MKGNAGTVSSLLKIWIPAGKQTLKAMMMGIKTGCRIDKVREHEKTPIASAGLDNIKQNKPEHKENPTE
jgi:hypothetical protein